MLRSHLTGTQLMRRLPWPLALPVRWFSVGDPDKSSATWNARLYRLCSSRKHKYSLPILRPWHGRYHDDKSDTGLASFGTASLIPLKPLSKSIDRIGIRLGLCCTVSVHDGRPSHTRGGGVLLVGLTKLGPKLCHRSLLSPTLWPTICPA